MFFYPSEAEGLAWLEAGNEAWGARAAGWYEAALERGPDEEAPDVRPGFRPVPGPHERP